jgi:hypothetical protein
MLISAKESTMEDIEKWVDVVGYDGLYRVSDAGRIRRGERILSGHIGNHGYIEVGLWRYGKGKIHLLHSLIMAAFVGPRPRGCEIDHIDCKKTNNRITNLEYVPKRENIRRQWANGLGCSGERCGTSKLKGSDVDEIRRLAETGVLQRIIAEQFDISRSHVSSIVGRKWWKQQ